MIRINMCAVFQDAMGVAHVNIDQLIKTIALLNANMTSSGLEANLHRLQIRARGKI
jgi:hypothetical protein